MALNLSRGTPKKYYSSNRIASLVANGIMTFIDKKTELNEKNLVLKKEAKRIYNILNKKNYKFANKCLVKLI